MRGWRSGVAIDHKHELTARELPGWQLVIGCAAGLELWGPEHPRLIVRPVAGDLERGGPYDRLAVRVLERGNAGWYNDEVHNVAPAGRMQLGLERLWIEGRSRRVPVVAATTRPMGVHNLLLANASHLVIFQLLLPGDRRKLASYVGDALLDRGLLQGAHTFGHYRSDSGELVVYGPLPPS